MLIPFGAGEEMRTEISTKFLRPGLEGIYGEAGLELKLRGEARGKVARLGKNKYVELVREKTEVHL